MIVGTVKETFPGERRVAITPHVVPALIKAGCEVLVESGAGAEAGFLDAAYVEKEANIAGDRAQVFRAADVMLQVRGYGANVERGRADLEHMRRGQTLIATFEPLTAAEAVRETAARGVTLLALELVPRISRAQSMDVLSSMATISGYKAVLLAANSLGKMFPMMMTAAGTITPARVFVIGAGVSGLQAIASAKRLGARVEAYDLRPVVKEQVESIGAKFIEMDLEAGESEGKGGYAKTMGEEFYKRQRELMTSILAETDVVITTAAVPGKKAPLLITREMVQAMQPGSIIVDLPAEHGGNCELSRPGETVVHHGVTIIGPVNLASTVPFHASQMFAKNITALLQLILKDGKLQIDMEDEVIRETIVAQDGEIGNPRVREALGLAEATT